MKIFLSIKATMSVLLVTLLFSSNAFGYGRFNNAYIKSVTINRDGDRVWVGFNGTQMQPHDSCHTYPPENTEHRANFSLTSTYGKELYATLLLAFTTQNKVQVALTGTCYQNAEELRWVQIYNY